MGERGDRFMDEREQVARNDAFFQRETDEGAQEYNLRAAEEVARVVGGELYWDAQARGERPVLRVLMDLVRADEASRHMLGGRGPVWVLASDVEDLRTKLAKVEDDFRQQGNKNGTLQMEAYDQFAKLVDARARVSDLEKENSQLKADLTESHATRVGLTERAQELTLQVQSWRSKARNQERQFDRLAAAWAASRESGVGTTERIQGLEEQLADTKGGAPGPWMSVRHPQGLYMVRRQRPDLGLNIYEYTGTLSAGALAEKEASARNAEGASS